MQEENLKDGMAASLSVEDLFLNSQETYEEAQQRATEENKMFAKTEYFRMDKLGVYRLRVLPLAPSVDGSIERKSYELPVHQMLLELEKPSAGGKPAYIYVTVARATDCGFSVDIIDTYRKIAVEVAKQNGDEKLSEKIGGGSYGGGLKYSYGHSLYILDLDERIKGAQLLTLSHSQFKDLDERKFKLWQKKLAKNPNYPCPISSIRDAYPIEIEKKKNGSKTEYVINIDNESETDELSMEELSGLLKAPRIHEIAYRYTRYHLEATLEFLKQCDAKYGLHVSETAEVREAIEKLKSEIPASDTSSFSFDKRSKDSKENQDNNRISPDNLFNRFDELQDQGLNDKTEEGQELRSMIRSFIEQEGLLIRVTRSTSNQDLLDLIEEALQGNNSSNSDEDNRAPEASAPQENSPNNTRSRQRRSY